jgi:hypothetical protein
MTTQIYAQFSDGTQATIVAVFCCAQDSTVFPNQATIDDSDPRYASFFAMAESSFKSGLPNPST